MLKRHVIDHTRIVAVANFRVCVALLPDLQGPKTDIITVFTHFSLSSVNEAIPSSYHIQNGIIVIILQPRPR